MAQITNQDVLNALSESLENANSYLMETAPDRFNRNLLNILQQEIELGKKAAQRHRYRDPDSRTYVYYADFPMAIYEAIPADFRLELEARNITLYRKEGIKTAIISIVYHF